MIGGTLGLGAVALGVCLVLEVTLEPLPVELPPALSDEMVFCPPSDGTPGVPAAGFWIDRFEVTVHDYRDFMAATGRPMPQGATLWSDSWTGPGSLPATCMTLDDARAYAGWRGKRLPTSPEWEFAARGPSALQYPWGDRFGDRFFEALANTAELNLGRPTLVGTFFNGQSFCGAYDLVGNVWEWTESQTGEFEVRNILRGGSFSTPGRNSMDAPPELGFSDEPDEWAPRDRGLSLFPEQWGTDVGFRCVAEPRAVETDRRLREAVAKLGVRDPLGILFKVRPAMAELRDGDPEVRRLLVRALALNGNPVVRARIESLIGTEAASR